MEPCLLYVISPPVIEDINRFAEDLHQIVQQGGERVGAFQLRLKQQGTAVAGRLTELPAEEERILRYSEILVPLCREAGVPFIMNDATALAKAVGADGVHLGQEDGNIQQARSLLGADAVIGISCHASRHLAMEAGEAGADYVAFGAFYPTRSKSEESLKHWGTPTTDILRWWTEITVLPCVAIGGIQPENARPLIAAGADFIATISALWNHPAGVKKAMDAFIHVLDEENERKLHL